MNREEQDRIIRECNEEAKRWDGNGEFCARCNVLQVLLDAERKKGEGRGWVTQDRMVEMITAANHAATREEALDLLSTMCSEADNIICDLRVIGDEPQDVYRWATDDEVVDR